MADMKTVTLTGSETGVKVNGYKCRVRNDSTEIVYASYKSGISPGADGVISINAGSSEYVDIPKGNIYLKGSGTVLLYGTDYEASLKNNKDAASNISAISALKGLQGGVPFSEIVLGGDIKDAEITLRSCGKNLIRYPYDYKSGTISGVNFTINEDGSVSAVGTAQEEKFKCFEILLPIP